MIILIPALLPLGAIFFFGKYGTVNVSPGASWMPKMSVEPPPGGRRTLLLSLALGSKPWNMTVELADIPETNLKVISWILLGQQIV
jgi:hypothetical protein